MDPAARKHYTSASFIKDINNTCAFPATTCRNVCGDKRPIVSFSGYLPNQRLVHHTLYNAAYPTGKSSSAGIPGVKTMSLADRTAQNMNTIQYLDYFKIL